MARSSPLKPHYHKTILLRLNFSVRLTGCWRYYYANGMQGPEELHIVVNITVCSQSLNTGLWNYGWGRHTDRLSYYMYSNRVSMHACISHAMRHDSRKSRPLPNTLALQFDALFQTFAWQLGSWECQSAFICTDDSSFRGAWPCTQYEYLSQVNSFIMLLGLWAYVLSQALLKFISIATWSMHITHRSQVYSMIERIFYKASA